MLRPIPLPLQNAYAELTEQCAATELAREFPSYGGFAVKRISGQRYVYWQGQINGRRAQKFVGPETPELLERVARHKDLRAADIDQRGRLVSALTEGGVFGPPAAAGKIVMALSEAGVFRAGGVLIGSWAYAAYPALLGFYLPMQLAQTQDLDVALVEVTVDAEPIDAAKALQTADASFVPAFSTAHASSGPYAFVNRDGYRVEFLTSLGRRRISKPTPLKSVKASALPLKFLEYLVESSLSAVVLYRQGFLVHVPSPLRFAFHKLIVSQIRTRESAIKSAKDISQAAAILEAFLHSQPLRVTQEWKTLIKRGPAWRKHALAGSRQLPEFLQGALKG